nr:hypothetical protein CFP56_54619 [Quercus suber]
MAEELEKLWKKLSFTEEEDESISLANPSPRVQRRIGTKGDTPNKVTILDTDSQPASQEQNKGNEPSHWGHDRWLPTLDSFKVLSPKRQESRLDNLLDLDRGGWDIEKVRGTFLHHEAEVILGIPISLRLLEDFQSWAWTKNGAFFVRSGYEVALKILEELKQGGEGGE